ncbi:MAG: TolC family protein [Planctomycetes bacterium]|nr:TolC family protein [Planctomycetota bacterium]
MNQHDGSNDEAAAGSPAPSDEAAADSLPPNDKADADDLPRDEATANSELAEDRDIAPRQGVVFSLSDTLAYALLHSRELQDAKEDLFSTALELSLERHLWTPQFAALISEAAFVHSGSQIDAPRREFSASSALSVTQRLPFGGQISASLLSNLLRDLEARSTTSESGVFSVAANIPLLRGAGHTAYETRYQAERSLVYAVRTYERFRRSFAVDIAADYFNLQQRKASIANARISYENRGQDYRRAQFIGGTVRSRNVFDAPRAKSSWRAAEANLVSAIEQYETALDRLKIRLRMPVETPLDVVDQHVDTESIAVEQLLPSVDENTAASVALAYRLDLLTTADALDDRKRDVLNAENRIWPDLQLVGRVDMNSDPDQPNSAGFNKERAVWSAGVTFQMDDRRTEITEFRRALIGLRQAERNYERDVDTVRSDVRRAMRRVDQQDNLRQIQELNVDENALRVAAARERFRLGKSTNQDVIDAEDDLLDARNDLASAVSSYRVAILEFRLDTGTLRLDDTGRWVYGGNEPDPLAADDGSDDGP